MNPNPIATFEGENGHTFQQEEANAMLVKGKTYEVVGGYMASSSSAYELKEFPGKMFNTVLFKDDDEAFDWLIEKDYPGFLNKKNK